MSSLSGSRMTAEDTYLKPHIVRKLRQYSRTATSARSSLGVACKRGSHVASTEKFVVTLCAIRLIQKPDDMPRHKIDEHLATSIFQKIGEMLHRDVRPS